jgi:hypothetical protein
MMSYINCSLPSIIKVIKSRRIGWSRTSSMHGVKLTAYRILVGRPQGKRLLGTSKCRWVDIIEMDLRETEWSGVDWINLEQDRDQ